MSWKSYSRCALSLVAGALLAGASPTFAEGKAESAPSTDDAAPRAAEPRTATLPAAPDTVIPVAITSQGGISLGAYEAGLQWAIMELLRHRASNDSFVTQRQAPAIFPKLRVHLVASAGASAGNANTFLGLLNYCRADGVQAQGIPDGSSYARNWFWETWVPMGLDQLFPVDSDLGGYCLDLGARSGEELKECVEDLRKRSRGSVYRDDDALLSRNAYNRMERLLRRMVEPDGKPLEVMDPNCLYPVGVPLTQTSTSQMGWDGSLEPTDARDQIEMPVSRALAVLDPECEGDRTKPCSIRLKNYDWSFQTTRGPERRHRLGWILDLPEQLYSGGRRVPASTVNVLIEAGSAVPLAFGAKSLEFCDPNGERPLAKGMACPDGLTMSVKRRDWYDGGTFDNLPIGLAYELASAANTFAPPHIIAIDVSRPRYEPKYRGQPVPPKGDLFGVLGTLTTVIPIARKYELQGLARYMSAVGKESQQQPAEDIGRNVHPTSRYFPVVGESLGAFGAFLGRPFREYDYHMGVYDGIHYIAQAICAGFGKPNEEGLAPDAWLNRVPTLHWWSEAKKDDLRDCVVEIFKESYDVLGLVTNDLHLTALDKDAGEPPDEEEIQKSAGSVAVLTALTTEIQVTGRFVVDGVEVQDFLPGEAKWRGAKSGGAGDRIDFKAYQALAPRISEVPDEALQQRSVRKAEETADEGDGGRIEEGACVPPRETNRKYSGDQTLARYNVFRNVLQTGQCIATNGPTEHPDSDDLWLSDFLGPEFLFFAANLRKVDGDVNFLRGSYLTWKKECKDVLAEDGSLEELAKCTSRIPNYLEEGLAMSIRAARTIGKEPHRIKADRYEGFVESPENWSMVFASRLLNRLSKSNDEHGLSEFIVDATQLVLRFKERQTAPGFQFGPSITPWRVDCRQRVAVAFSRVLLPSFLGTGIEFYPDRDNVSAMAFTFEMWRTQLAFADGRVALYVTPQANFQATEFQRFTLGGTGGLGFRTANVVVSELEGWIGPSMVRAGEGDPFGYSGYYGMWQFGGSLYFFGGILRLSVGARYYFIDGSSRETPSPFFTVGISDIPGIAYWILKLST
jgi:hypothetical protein